MWEILQEMGIPDHLTCLLRNLYAGLMLRNEPGSNGKTLKGHMQGGMYKKDLHDPGNHDGVITYLEPDILIREAKWALGSVTTNKASGGDGIPIELFRMLKDDAVKLLH